MTKPVEPTAEQMLERMRTDADLLDAAAEIINRNRQATAVITQRYVKRHKDLDMSDEAARGFTDLMANVLHAFLDEMRDAIERFESGDADVTVTVVPMDDSETKH